MNYDDYARFIFEEMICNVQIAVLFFTVELWLHYSLKFYYRSLVGRILQINKSASDEAYKQSIDFNIIGLTIIPLVWNFSYTSAKRWLNL